MPKAMPANRPALTLGCCQNARRCASRMKAKFSSVVALGAASVLGAGCAVSAAVVVMGLATARAVAVVAGAALVGASGASGISGTAAAGGTGGVAGRAAASSGCFFSGSAGGGGGCGAVCAGLNGLRSVFHSVCQVLGCSRVVADTEARLREREPSLLFIRCCLCSRRARLRCWASASVSASCSERLTVSSFA